jgi:hypothetical protein
MFSVGAHADAIGNALFIADHPVVDDAKGLAGDLVGAR